MKYLIKAIGSDGQILPASPLNGTSALPREYENEEDAWDAINVCDSFKIYNAKNNPVISKMGSNWNFTVIKAA